VAQADVLTLVDDLSLGQANATEAAIFYAEIIRELGFIELLTGTETIAVHAGTSSYTLATDTIRALEFYNTSGFLTKAAYRGLGALFGSSWRNRTGSPLAVTVEDENNNSFSLVPSPNYDDTLTVIRTETRTDVPVWLELPIAMEILNREFLRESDHQDIEFAGLAKMIANLLFNLVGVFFNAQETSQRDSSVV
jgi:hypothetical protein